MYEEPINEDNVLEMGSIDVDAGCIWVGDPCYVLRDPGESRPKDLGENWSDICSRFFERSGYNDEQKRFQEADTKRRNAMMDEIRPRMEEPGFNLEAEIQAFQAKHPLTEYLEGVREDCSVANFTHDQHALRRRLVPGLRRIRRTRRTA